MNDYHRNALQYLQEHPEIATTPAGMALGYLLFKNISGTLGGGAVGYGAGRLASSDSEPTLRRKTDENLAEIKSVAPRLRAAATSQTGPAPAVPGVSDIADRAALKTRVDTLLNDAAKPVGTGTADTVARSMKMLAEAKTLAAAVDAQQRKLQIARAAVGDKTPVADPLAQHSPVNPSVDVNPGWTGGVWDEKWPLVTRLGVGGGALGVAGGGLGWITRALAKSNFNRAADLLGGNESARQLVMQLVRDPEAINDDAVKAMLPKTPETRQELDKILKTMMGYEKSGIYGSIKANGGIATRGLWGNAMYKARPVIPMLGRHPKSTIAGIAALLAAYAGLSSETVGQYVPDWSLPKWIP